MADHGRYCEGCQILGLRVALEAIVGIADSAVTKDSIDMFSDPSDDAINRIAQTAKEALK